MKPFLYCPDCQHGNHKYFQVCTGKLKPAFFADDLIKYLDKAIKEKHAILKRIGSKEIAIYAVALENFRSDIENSIPEKK